MLINVIVLYCLVICGHWYICFSKRYFKLIWKHNECPSYKLSYFRKIYFKTLLNASYTYITSVVDGSFLWVNWEMKLGYGFIVQFWISLIISLPLPVCLVNKIIKSVLWLSTQLSCFEKDFRKYFIL